MMHRHVEFFGSGYCAPEYENCGKMSKKVDMYSLGVIIIELVTGRKGDPNKTNVRVIYLTTQMFYFQNFANVL